MSNIWQRLVDAWSRPDARSLPTDSDFRKDIPVACGFNRYFPAAIVAIAAWSKVANDKHNPGEPLHWARGKSMDQDDCLARHDLDLADAQRASDGVAELEEATCAAWRANARLQLLCERLGAPLAPNARLPLDDVDAPVQAAPATPPTARTERWGLFYVLPDGTECRSRNFPGPFVDEVSAMAARSNADGALHPSEYVARRLP